MLFFGDLIMGWLKHAYSLHHLLSIEALPLVMAHNLELVAWSVLMQSTVQSFCSSHWAVHTVRPI